MAEESDLEKTEQPSERRLQQAREEGQVATSRELASFLVLATGVACMWVMGGWVVQRCQDMLRHGLVLDRRTVFDTEVAMGRLPEFALDALLSMMPFFAALIVAGAASTLALSGFNFSAKAFSPQFSRMSPLSGIQRMFSVDSLMELFKAVIKTLIVGSVAAWVVMRDQEAVFSLFSLSIEQGMASLGHQLLMACTLLVAGLGLIAAIDVPFQLFQYTKRLRMTKEELKQEAKEQDGNPEIKARIRSIQREMARKRMMSEVPLADVVVTNPTHYSVAIKYDREKSGAPRVVAKGTGDIALKIREIAAENKVPRLEAPPLARALYKHTEIGDQIPVALYRAVAEVMAYVYQLNDAIAGQGVWPDKPEDLEVPAEMDPGPG